MRLRVAKKVDRQSSKFWTFYRGSTLQRALIRLGIYDPWMDQPFILAEEQAMREDNEMIDNE